MKVVDDITALDNMWLICAQVDRTPKVIECNETICNYQRSACDIINDLLKTNKWLACEALANMHASFNSQPYIYPENRKVYEEIKEDIYDYFNY